MLPAPFRTVVRSLLSNSRFAGLLLFLAVCAAPEAVHAQTVTKTNLLTNIDVKYGDTLYGAMLASDGNYYATSIAAEFMPLEPVCPDGNECSYIYKIAPDGTTTIFHTFEVDESTATNVEGSDPNPIIQGTDGNFYGSNKTGGSGGQGTIFKITPAGVLTVLYTFPLDIKTNNPYNGAQPSPIIQGKDGNFYGTTLFGGPSASDTFVLGTVFSMTPAGNVTTIYAFPSGGPGDNANPYGADPEALVQGADGLLYGTTQYSPYPVNGSLVGAPIGLGTIFSIATDGTGITTLHEFAPDGSEGSTPYGPLVQGADGSFYGATGIATVTNGPTLTGGVFKVSPGGNFQVVYHFTGGADGQGPDRNLTLAGDGNLYGTAVYGGNPANCPYIKGCGVIFQLSPTGAEKTIYSFLGGDDGGVPSGPLVPTNDGGFFGTTEGSYIGQTSGFGTAYKLAFDPALPAVIQIILTDPSNGQVVTSVAPNTKVKLSWKVLNAFSSTMQLCHASVQGSVSDPSWTGVPTGTFAGGVLSGSVTVTPTTSASYTYALTCGGTESGFSTLTAENLDAIVTTTLPDATVGDAYTDTVVATGGTPPYTWTSIGAPLPAGVTLSPSTGVLSGLPKQFGNYAITLQAADRATPPAVATATLPLTVQSGLQITTTLLKKGAMGTAYKQTLKATGGTQPYAWSVTSGTLPDGITLDAATGLLSGIPKKIQKQTIVFQVADSETTKATKTATLILNVVEPQSIASVEFTQGIQQYQSLDDLKATLTANGEPPAAIIAGRPTVMRVYFSPVTKAATVKLAATGAPTDTKTLSLQPNCQPQDQRSHTNGCPSMDFYFTPVAGSTVTTLTLTDADGATLETETLTYTVRAATKLVMKALSVCDTNNGPAHPLCGDNDKVVGNTSGIRKLLPESTITAVVIPTKVMQSSLAKATYGFIDASLVKVAKLYTPADRHADAVGGMHTNYVGVYDITYTPLDGAVASLPGNALMMPNTFTVFGTELFNQIIAHESGHTLNLHHTNTALPLYTTQSFPSCWSPAGDDTTYWKFPDNYIQSTDGQEWGFDLTTNGVVDPMKNFDVMGYCAPAWISPINYDKGIGVTSSSVTAQALRNHSFVAKPKEEREDAPVVPPLTQGSYWQIAGTITSNGATLDPIFATDMQGTTDAGSGTYAIQARDSSGQPLFTRNFTPTTLTGDAVSGALVPENSIFSEWIPVTPGTASIVVSDATGNRLSTTSINGVGPTVTITSPASGTGQQTISWTAQEPGITTFTSQVYYSADNGTTWTELGETTDSSSPINFTTLPGSAGALLRVYVSDGANTGSATSSAFAVPKNVPSSVVIYTPVEGLVQPAANVVFFDGSAYDADDGALTGSALSWSSDVQGVLGTGEQLVLALKPGKHVITLTATDSDGNAITATTTITLAGAPPTLTLTTDQGSTNCLAATIAANAGAEGAALTQVQYSADGGATYTSIALNTLPYTFTVPGSGSINLVARAQDASGQTAAESEQVSQGGGCGAAALTVAAGAGQSIAVGQKFSTPLKVVLTDGSGKAISGVAVSFAAPASGASATLSASTVTTGSDGSASVTATANQTPGSYSVTASTPSVASTAIFALTNATPIAPDFHVAAAAGALTVTRGSSVTDSIILTTAGGFSGIVNLSCTGLPEGATCSFSPASVTPKGATVSSTLTISTAKTSARLDSPFDQHTGEKVLACFLFGAWLLRGKRSRLTGLLSLGIAAILLTSVTGCGSSSSSKSTITIVAKSAAVQHTTTLTLTIR